MKKLIWLTLCCILLSGCSSGNLSENSGQEYAAESVEKESEENAVFPEDTGFETEDAYEPLSQEEKDEVIKFLEKFEDKYVFTDMDQELAVSYGEPIAEYYDFLGRKTEDGYGYVLAFRKTGKDPLENLSIYGLDGYTEAEIWDDQKSESKVVYSFKKTGWIYRGDNGDILYLQPIDMEEPEELQKVFVYQYCSGEEGVLYLEDAVERGIRFTPPDTEAYLAADRFENGKEYWEFAILTKEEEQEILDSDEWVDADLYGEYGLQFFVSQETYENEEKEEAEITVRAVEIAKEKFRFEIVEPKEIHDIVKAELSMHVWDNDEDKDFSVVTEVLEDVSQLKELEDILSNSKIAGEGKCPYTGALTLTREDQREIVVYLATDSCDGFILGSHGVYSPGKEATERIWELFPEVRKYTGWALEEDWK